jgi:hypothetical protein
MSGDSVPAVKPAASSSPLIFWKSEIPIQFQ